MISTSFDYQVASSVEEALRSVTSSPNARLLAGGVGLLPDLKLRKIETELLVDISHLRPLQGIDRSSGSLRIGALVTHAAIGRSEVLGDLPVFSDAARLIGDRQVRNRGTLGGNVAHGSLGADWPAVLLALGGVAHILSEDGEHSMDAERFYASGAQPPVKSNELLLGIEIPLAGGRSGSAYVRPAKPASGFVLPGAAAWLRLDERGVCGSLRVGIMGANRSPFRAHSVERGLTGRALDDEAVRDACTEIEELDPFCDALVSAEYRSQLARVQVVRAIRAAAVRARQAN